MNIQIDGAGFNNRGAELMLLSVLDRLNAESSLKPQFIFHSRFLEDVPKSSALKMKQLYTVYRYKIPFYKFLPAFLYQDYGIVSYKNTDHIIDIGGYHIGDPWMRSKRYFSVMKTMYKNVKNKGGKIIYLPQAFGPFEQEYSKYHLTVVMEYADVLYCRDKQSLHYLENLTGKSDKVKLAPDFTAGLVANSIPVWQSNGKACVGIIPNTKMFQYQPEAARDTYISFLKELITHLQLHKFEVQLINHEAAGDRKIIEALSGHFEGSVSVHLERSALELKSLISTLDFLYSDRYHGAINGLSQGIPTITCGWSHKYNELFDSYNFPEGMATLNGKDICNKLLLWNEKTKYSQIKEKLNVAKNRITSEVENMWDEVINLLK